MRHVARIVCGLVLVAACGGGAGMADSPLEARAFGATACGNDVMFVWGGAAPDRDGDLVAEPRAGGALYRASSNEWTAVTTAPIPARQFAAAAWLVDDQAVLVAGGSDRTDVGSNPDAGDLFSGVLVYDVATSTWSWAGKLFEPRNAPTIAITEQLVMVVGGSTRLGPNPPPTTPVVLDRATGSVTPVPLPPSNSTVVSVEDEITAVSPSGIARFDPQTLSWQQISQAWPTVDTPARAVEHRGTALVLDDSGELWAYDGERWLGSAATGHPGAQLVGSGDRTVIWDESGPYLGEIIDLEIVEVRLPDRLGSRRGTSACLLGERFVVWGGWETVETAEIARATGYVVDLDG